MTKRVLAKQITEAADIDQNIRSKVKSGKGVLNMLYYLIDQLHYFRIHDWIKKHGYPTQKMIGKDAMHGFWLLIMHQYQDKTLQKACSKYCDFSSADAATLTDRLRIGEGKKQIFGTHLKRTDNNTRLEPHPIKDPRNVDKRRKKVGLGLLAKHIQEEMNDLKKRKILK